MMYFFSLLSFQFVVILCQNLMYDSNHLLTCVKFYKLNIGNVSVDNYIDN